MTSRDTAAPTARPTLILGSASPRRRELLSVVGLGYEVIKPDIEEVPKAGESPETYVLRNAREKGAVVAAMVLAKQAAYPAGAIVISADTIVVLGDDILEKPRDKGHAAEMLRRLSGRTHTVVSGVALSSVGRGSEAEVETVFATSTIVKIKTLTESEIAAYVKTGEPLDKAGAYAAQGIGSYMVERIEGSYANVVGLPIAEVVSRLERDFGYPLFES